MRFWPPFHIYSLTIISDCPRKLIFQVPNYIRLQMTVNHLISNENPGSCLTQYNRDNCLWECYHSPCTTGHHRLFIWVLDTEGNNQWLTAVRFDVYIQQKLDSFVYPITTDLFNRLRCQLFTPMNGIILRESLPCDIVIRIPCVRAIQLQIDEYNVLSGESLPNDIYRIPIPLGIPSHVTSVILMGLCFEDLCYSIIITYLIE